MSAKSASPTRSASPSKSVTTGTKSAEEDGRKVFIGNLSFQTSQGDLKDFFREVALPTNVTIVHRNTQSLGYGFVTFATASEANKAISTMNEKELQGRKIRVEIAKPKEEIEEGAAPRRSSGGRGRGGRGGRRGRGGSRRAPGGGRTKTPQRFGEASKTLIHVGNLPFTVNDDQLKDIFKDFSITSAHVETKESGMSKGYGFVEFETETEQKRALTVMNGIEVEGRAIAVKVARALLTDSDQQEESAE